MHYSLGYLRVEVKRKYRENVLNWQKKEKDPFGSISKEHFFFTKKYRL